MFSLHLQVADTKISLKHEAKGKAIPLQVYRPWGFQVVEALRFQDSRHMKVVRLLAMHTGRVYPPENIPGTHFC